MTSQSPVVKSVSVPENLYSKNKAQIIFSLSNTRILFLFKQLLVVYMFKINFFFCISNSLKIISKSDPLSLDFFLSLTPTAT